MLIETDAFSILANEIEAIHFAPLFTPEDGLLAMTLQIKVPELGKATVYTKHNNRIVTSNKGGETVLLEWKKWQTSIKSEEK